MFSFFSVVVRMVDEISSKDFVNLKCLGGEFGYVLGCFENEVNV